ncbi:unnamed protein product [Rangifer tarandus platyrhynchus]|uniref:Uncharacterized protein n=1 Tax=Rangifer tarandus platyrhynchus TaxID=3082113 RepID=A0AC59ZPZ0_RANTA
MWREAASPAAEPPAGIAAPRGGDADCAGRPGERAGAAACGNPLNPVAAEAAEMLVRAARPTASSTFSGYRYVPEGNLGPAGVLGEGTVGRRKSGRRIRGERERERESGRGRSRSKAREEHQGALRLRARGAPPKSPEAGASSPQLPPGARQRLARGARA